MLIGHPGSNGVSHGRCDDSGAESKRTVLGDDVKLLAVRTRDAVPRPFVTAVAMRRNLIQVMQRAVRVERVDEERVATAGCPSCQRQHTRRSQARCDLHVRDVGTLETRVDVDSMTTVPQRDPRLVRFRVSQLFLAAVEVDHLLQLLAEAARRRVDGECLGNWTASLVYARRSEAEGSGRDGQVRASRSCVLTGSQQRRLALQKKTEAAAAHKWAPC